MMLSILLPSYENSCLTLVRQLAEQAALIPKLEYEIIVVEDGGSNHDTIAADSVINSIPNCRYLVQIHNRGRAAVRNFLASLARGEWLLFLDSDVVMVSNDFLLNYVDLICAYEGETIVADGGVTALGNPVEMRHNLRFWYEYKAQPQHTVEAREKRPYQCIHTANLLIKRSIMEEEGFDERFTGYGYEDVLFGKRLQKARIRIIHFDTPVGLDKFESNQRYLEKTEEAITTLHRFRTELDGFSTLLKHCKRIQALHLSPLVKLFHRIACPMEKANLTSQRPSLLVYKLYKVGLYISLT